jgi:hypothetical protein
MTVRVSTKFKELLLGTSSFASIFNGGRILLYTGEQPDHADLPVQGTLLAQITEQGIAWQPNGAAGGLNFSTSGPYAVNDPTQNWKLVASAAGTAGWFRLVGKSIDNGGYSSAAPRLDGSVGVAGTVDLRLDSNILTVGYTIAVQQFVFTFPSVSGA